MCELKVDRSFLEEAEIVTRETGLTPRQLLDQRDKLLRLVVDYLMTTEYDIKVETDNDEIERLLLVKDGIEKVISELKNTSV